MKVLLVNGSPHKNGSTNRALEEVATTLNKNGIETEIFRIGNRALSGCIACKTCVKTGKCVFDDSVNKCREKALEADGFIFGSPVHYAAASGSMTAFMDRLFYSEFCGNQNKAFYLKPAAAVVVARRAGTTSTYDQLNKYFGLHEMPIFLQGTGISFTARARNRWKKIPKVCTRYAFSAKIWRISSAVRKRRINSALNFPNGDSRYL